MTATLKLPTYACKLVFIVTSELFNDTNRLLKKLNLRTINSAAEAWTFSGDLDAYYLLIDSAYISHNTIAHELFHTVQKMTKDRDIRDEEAAAWLVGYMAEFIYKTLDKKKLTVKHG